MSHSLFYILCVVYSLRKQSVWFGFIHSWTLLRVEFLNEKTSNFFKISRVDANSISARKVLLYWHLHYWHLHLHLCTCICIGICICVKNEIRHNTSVEGGCKCKKLGSIEDGRTKYWLACRKRDDSENFSKKFSSAITKFCGGRRN